MDAVARLNAVFRKAAKVDCAILRNSYCNDGLGSEFHIYSDNGKLLNRGYSYEFLSEAMLELPICRVSNKRLDEDGPAYKCLIIDKEKYLSTSFLKRVRQLAEEGLPIIWIGEKPIGSRYYSESNTEEKQSKWQAELNTTWTTQGIAHVNLCEAVPEILQQIGVLPEIMLDRKKDQMTAVHEDDKMRYIALYAYNRVEYAPDELNPDEFGVSGIFKKGTMKSTYQRPGRESRETVKVKFRDVGEGEIWRCNPWSGTMERIGSGAVRTEMYCELQIEIEEDELLLFAIEKDGKHSFCNSEKVKRIAQREKTGSISFDRLELEEFCPNEEGEVSFLRSGFKKFREVIINNELLPWRKMDYSLKSFVGRGIYHGTIQLEKKGLNEGYILSLGNACDTFRVRVNGKETSFPDQVMKEVEVTGLLREGKNELEVIVTSNLYNKLLWNGISWKAGRLPYTPKDYGIWSTESKPICLYCER